MKLAVAAVFADLRVFCRISFGADPISEGCRGAVTRDDFRRRVARNFSRRFGFVDELFPFSAISSSFGSCDSQFTRERNPGRGRRIVSQIRLEADRLLREATCIMRANGPRRQMKFDKRNRISQSLKAKLRG